MLRDVRPVLPSRDLPDGAFGNAKPSAYRRFLFPRCKMFFDFNNLILSQFCRPASAAACAAAFLVAVFGVGNAGSQEQMIWINAEPIVASVTDAQARGNHTECVLVCDAVSAEGFLNSIENPAVSGIFESRSLPRPTAGISGWANQRQEPISHGAFLEISHASVGTKSVLSGERGEELLPTMFAGDGSFGTVDAGHGESPIGSLCQEPAMVLQAPRRFAHSTTSLGRSIEQNNSIVGAVTPLVIAKAIEVFGKVAA